MLTHLHNYQILYLDIETVAQYSEYDKLPDRFKNLWNKKAKQLARNEEPEVELLYERAGIYAEFGKIICISVGYYEAKTEKFRIKSFFNHDESLLLKEFAGLLNQYFHSEKDLLCAHNGKEFDFPYIARRMLVNQIPLPKLLDIAGKKPWEIQHLDTMELWKFGDYKHFTSLELLTAIFNVPSPKADIDGSEVGKIYWQDNNLERIARYCQNDVLALAQVMNVYRGRPLWNTEQIEYINLKD